ncbi:MAG: MotA/TolQ/ExbB proton channel family protein [Gammaproteobacteria bacterium]|nr:MotA/TolQ/ExbB proton channel family protein [Gammaproteobacteria bacterium]NIN62696.1 MotA/TolQ/ExbB proton channel family protein [Gammaproteobacteria bacterium]NIO63234.1 MotA/TolQ/ExbB proton channel family protein [Gammaproteobacteria bacterium]NIQ11270.1 MotA/TolQ/ExbB proton channel family protein [Gammaproteobacteria bacterium]NIQ20334.1 MotA/TolQ/ExbB proton channel family protein [Gammaproteobacteria bacterium]
MKNLFLIIFSFSLFIPVQAEEITTLEELLKQVKEESLTQKKLNQQREERFLREYSEQKKLLEDATDLLIAEEKRSKALKSIYEQNEREINALDSQLSSRMGSLGELHGIVRQLANDVDSVIDSSLVSAQKPDRDDLIDELAASKSLPAISHLEEVWKLMLDEMVEAGKVAKFPAKIITNTGEETEKTVTRVGVFNVVADGRFLRFLPESPHLIEPGRQPAARFQSMAKELEEAESGIVPFPIDPTSGAMLALLIQVPDLMTRIAQGGPVGVLIITLGLIGLLIAITRYIKLNRIDYEFKVQMDDKTPGDNPLGRIMAVYQNNPDVDTETLELKLDEAILKELPVLQRGLRIISLLAEIALLLGLLGTVTGIIETFQSITLFGTGDPRVMSGGISQALVTTVMGLTTSIPLLLFHGFLSSKSNRLIHILDEKSAAFVAMLAEKRKQ